jgi:hypothetical protein
MNALTSAACLAAAITCLAGGPCAAAEDNDAGTPLAPADAAGPWTLVSDGRPICVVTLGKQLQGGEAYGFSAPAACADALPAGLAGWVPSPHGMDLVAADGRVLIGFGRWSNSLLVSHRSSGADLQLRRGASPE